MKWTDKTPALAGIKVADGRCTRCGLESKRYIACEMVISGFHQAALTDLLPSNTSHSLPRPPPPPGVCVFLIGITIDVMKVRVTYFDDT